MARDVTRTIGTGITARTKREVALDFIDPGDADIMRASTDAYNQSLYTPWGANADLIETIRAELTCIEASAPDPRADLKGYNAHFVERVSPGWYFKMIVVSAKIAEIAVEQGRPWEAIHHAMHIGELMTELRFKLHWEPAAIAGQSSIEGGRTGARQREALYSQRDAEIVEFYDHRRQSLDFSAAKSATEQKFGVTRHNLNRILRQNNRT